jgi:hypothetical protein
VISRQTQTDFEWNLWGNSIQFLPTTNNAKKLFTLHKVTLYLVKNLLHWKIFKIKMVYFSLTCIFLWASVENKKRIQFYFSFMYTTGYFCVKQTKLLICKRIFINFACEMYSTQIHNAVLQTIAVVLLARWVDHTVVIHCPERASESLLQISWLVLRKWHTILASTLSMCEHMVRANDEPICQQIINKTHSDDSRWQKWSCCYIHIPCTSV